MFGGLLFFAKFTGISRSGKNILDHYSAVPFLDRMFVPIDFAQKWQALSNRLTC
jgi:hypothetical protein